MPSERCLSVPPQRQKRGTSGERPVDCDWRAETRQVDLDAPLTAGRPAPTPPSGILISDFRRRNRSSLLHLLQGAIVFWRACSANCDPFDRLGTRSKEGK